jgi:hypothetical protein
MKAKLKPTVLTVGSSLNRGLENKPDIFLDGGINFHAKNCPRGLCIRFKPV